MTAQPSYFCIANLGDVDPFEHGGAFVCIDRRGIYDPILLIYDEDFDRRSEITLERCHKIVDDKEDFLGVGDNRFHPKCKTWFSDDLHSSCDFVGWEFDEFIDLLTSQDVVKLASAYLTLVGYYGVLEFDHDPYVYENKKDAKHFCDQMLKQIEESKTWHDGYFAKAVKINA
jgi:hypothetical protein